LPEIREAFSFGGPLANCIQLEGMVYDSWDSLLVEPDGDTYTTLHFTFGERAARIILRREGNPIDQEQMDTFVERVVEEERIAEEQKGR